MTSRHDIEMVAELKRAMGARGEVVLWDSGALEDIGMTLPEGPVSFDEDRNLIIITSQRYLRDALREAVDDAVEGVVNVFPECFAFGDDGVLTVIAFGQREGESLLRIRMHGKPHGPCTLAVVENTPDGGAKVHDMPEADMITWIGFSAMAEGMRWAIENPHMFPIVESRAQASRAIARSVKKSHNLDLPSIRVIELRPKIGGSHGVGTGEGKYRFRWDVRGHWRLQKVGVGRAEVRRTWVAGYEKGPKNAPKISRTTIKRF